MSKLAITLNTTSTVLEGIDSFQLGVIEAHEVEVHQHVVIIGKQRTSRLPGTLVISKASP